MTATVQRMALYLGNTHCNYSHLVMKLTVNLCVALAQLCSHRFSWEPRAHSFTHKKSEWEGEQKHAWALADPKSKPKSKLTPSSTPATGIETNIIPALVFTKSCSLLFSMHTFAHSMGIFCLPFSLPSTLTAIQTCTYTKELSLLKLDIHKIILLLLPLKLTLGLLHGTNRKMWDKTRWTFLILNPDLNLCQIKKFNFVFHLPCTPHSLLELILLIYFSVLLVDLQSLWFSMSYLYCRPKNATPYTEFTLRTDCYWWWFSEVNRAIKPIALFDLTSLTCHQYMPEKKLLTDLCQA